MHKHTLTFEGDVPETERERAGIWATPVTEAIADLQRVLAEAGHPHTVESKIIRPKVSKGPRKPRAVRQAAE